MNATRTASAIHSAIKKAMTYPIVTISQREMNFSKLEDGIVKYAILVVFPRMESIIVEENIIPKPKNRNEENSNNIRLSCS